MVVIKRRYKYVSKETNRHGKTVWYFRRDKQSPRFRLPAPDRDNFDQAYQAALNGEAFNADTKPQRTVYDQYTIGWLVTQFKASTTWQKQALPTQRSRALIIDKFVKDKGCEPITYLSKGNIKAELEKRAINEFLQIIRNMLKWAKEEEIVANNPAMDVKFLPRSENGFTPWTKENVEIYRKKYPIGTMPRLAMELLLFTGLRRSDIVRLSTAHLKNSLFSIRPQKTPKVIVTFPLHSQLKAIIDATPLPKSKDNIDCLTYIRNQYGKSYSPEGFTNTFRKWAVNAGLDDFSPHGGRKLAATLLAEAGATESQLMAAFGWTKAEMAQLYTKAANRAKMGVDAWTLIEQNPRTVAEGEGK